VAWDDGQSFTQYLRSISSGRYIKASPTPGRTFRASVTYGPAISGELRVNMVNGRSADVAMSGEARITLILNLNLTTTRAMAVRRNTAPLEALSEKQFFDPIMPVQEAFGEGRFAALEEMALDGKDNVLLMADEVGGASMTAREAARERFLAAYEVQLRQLADAIVSPRQTMIDAPNADAAAYRVRLDWGSLVLQHCEIYFERLTDNPVGLVRRLYDRGLELGRRAKAQRFVDVPNNKIPVPTSFAVEQDDGFPHLVIPLTGTRNVELSIYAKTNRRIRFEVRYKRRFGHHLKGCSTGDDRLASLLSRLFDNATQRLPWKSLAIAVRIQPSVDVADISRFFERLVVATKNDPDLFSSVIHQLVLTGGVIDDARHPKKAAAIQRLVRADVIWRWPVQQKEQRASRRYGLTEEYAGIRMAMLRGYMPNAFEYVPPPEPEMPEDHYEENARLAGGNAFVERPYSSVARPIKGTRQR
jgi:hypothetical protein